MIIYPAIDLLMGNCVRLYQGDYGLETIYSRSPFDVAKLFVYQGASWLHLIDLDGAKNPNANQAPLIKKLLSSITINIQVGGGIRSEAHIDAYLDAGAKRVIIGSLAVLAPEKVETWLKIYGPEKIILAFDIKFEESIPYVRSEAWQKASTIPLSKLLRHFADNGAKHILCTDISRDGALTGPNINLYKDLVLNFPELSIQASGGISEIADLTKLKEIQVAGAITGRALYEKKFNLSEALAC